MQTGNTTLDLRRERWRFVAAVLVGTGWAVSAYLLLRSFKLLERDAGGIDLCSAVFSAGCDAALSDPSSSVLGVPLAGWGLVYYAVLACLLILGRVLGTAFDREAALGALLVAGFGALASLILLGVIASGAVPFCPLCLVVHAINLALLPALKFHSRLSIREIARRLAAAGRYLAGKTAAPAETRWKVLGFVTTGLVGIVVFQWVYVQWALRSTAAAGPAPEQVRAAFAAEPQVEIPLDDDPRLGPAAAPVQLVVFSSFQCPGCREFAGRMGQLTGHFGEDISIVFKHFPISTQCNPGATRDKHPRACQAARAAEAARRQGRFWKFHDALFAAGLDIREETLHHAARQAELDLERFERDRRDPAVANKVSADVEAGNRIGVDATPAVFLNGRRVRHLSPWALDLLIHDEISRPSGDFLPGHRGNSGPEKDA